MERPSARVLLLEPGGRLLLFRNTTAAGTWLWFLPGGGLEPGETFEEAARRELWEETGRQDTLGPCVWTRDSTWYSAHLDRMVRSLERFYLVHVDAPFDPRPQHIGEYEEYMGLDGWNHWWSAQEIADNAGFEGLCPTSPARAPAAADRRRCAGDPVRGGSVNAAVLDGSSEERAIPRPGARVIVLDATRHVLLIRQRWDGGDAWFCPGGSLEPGETFEDAARRELREESGLDAEPGPWVCVRRARWETRGSWYDTTERFYLVRLAEETPPIAFTPGEDELTTLIEARWWDLADLREDGVPVSPLSLLVLLGPLVRGVVPDEPWEVGL